MATSNDRKRQRKGRKSNAKPLVATQRKKEVLGLIFMVIALLISLALLTYSEADDTIAQAFSLDAAINPGNNRAENALGLIGAALAWMLIPNFLGYPTLLLTGLLLIWGYVIFRNRTTIFLPLLSVLIIVATFVITSLFGWFGLALDADLSLWSGAVGLGTSGWMMRVFGSVGSLAMILLMLAVTLLLTFDHDIQHSLDRFEDVIRTLKTGFRKSWQAFRERRKKRKIERTDRLEKYRSTIEKERRERAADKQSNQEDKQKRPNAILPPSAGAADSLPSNVSGGTPRRETVTPYKGSFDASLQRAQTLNESFRFTPPPHDTFPESRHDVGADIELKIIERVSEEKTDFFEREPELPDDELVFPFEPPPIDLLDTADNGDAKIDFDELEDNKRVLLQKLETYNIEIIEINAIVGPTVTLYELTPAPGVKISRITALEDDLAMAMAARGIRMIAPIPGKTAIGVEIPNRHRELVPIRDVIATTKFRDATMELPVALGKTIEGGVNLEDLSKMPHLLIAGATGSGKSVGLNTLIGCLLYSCHPANLKFVMIDPKKIELQQYAKIVDHFIAMPDRGETPIITDVGEAMEVLRACEREMELRYNLLSKAAVRGVKDYNKKLKEGKLTPVADFPHLPYIVVIVDELADLMMTAGKDIEAPIARLAQMARAVGIHLVLATQRPSVDVITGLIKANFPSRIAYQVASKIDSRTILDQNGAEGLVGNGDLLYMKGSKIVRLQGPFVSVDEVDYIVDFIAEQPGKGPYRLPPGEEPIQFDDEQNSSEEKDDFFEEAARIIVRSQQGSVSLIQRRLSVGYSRAARIIDQLEDTGIVGPFVGSKAREVLVENEIQLDEVLKSIRQ